MRAADQCTYIPHPRIRASEPGGSFDRNREPRRIMHGKSVELVLARAFGYGWGKPLPRDRRLGADASLAPG